MTEYQEYFDKKFKEMEENNKTRNQELIVKINGFAEGVKKLARRQDLLAEENEVLRFEIQRLRNDLNYEQGRERAPNLIFRACKTKDDLEETLRNRILEILLEAKVAIQSEDLIAVSRVGKPNSEFSKVLPIKVRLSEPSLKKLIFPVAKQIRQKHNISIDNDYTPPQRDELYKIRCTRRSLLQRGIDCVIRGFNIVIKGQPHNWQAALRYSQRMIPQNDLSIQSQMEIDGGSSETETNKRKANQISPHERQLRRQALANNPNPIRPSQFTRSQEPTGYMDMNFSELFDNLG